MNWKPQHKRLLVARRLICQVLVIGLVMGCTSTPKPEPKPTLSILFIGNSYTYQNNLPQILAELAKSGGQAIVVDMVAEGGWKLLQHATSASTLYKIGQQKWTFVVLQEQSVVPSVEANRTQEMYPAVRLLDDQIQQAGSRTLLFMTWGRRDGFAEVGHPNFATMQSQLQAGYLKIAKERNLLVAPVGMAWQTALTQQPNLQLWESDGSHPSLTGSYLAACVFYAVIYRKSPEGLDYTAGLPQDTAQALQAIAATTVLNNSEQ
ncbi:hypothetical protein NDA01_17860 [Trichocoleus desertorum AS-A10]|uniref:DUF4886 domain-containing protein n=1 Tax=Trichocoleus desertorum TaxID=1481672 RepID=UPI00329A5928